MISNVIFSSEDLAVEEITLDSRRDPEDAQIKPFSNKLVEICAVVSGSGVHRVMSRDIPCSKGDLFVVNAEIPHGYFVSEAGEAMTLQRILFCPEKRLTPGKDGDNTSCYGVFNESPAVSYAMMNTEEKAVFDSCYEAIEREISEMGSEWESAVRFHIALLLISVGRYVNGAIKSDRTAVSKEWKLVMSAMSVIDDNYSDRSLTLESVACQCLVSSSCLSRVFSEISGYTFSEYVRKVRVDRACQLLADSELSIEEIIAECGLRDISSFYKVFNAHTGLTPNTYRNEEKSKKFIKSKGEKIMVILSEISAQLQAGKAKLVKEMVQQAIDEGVSPETILKEGLLPGMNVIGEKFKNNEIFVPEVLIAARAMKMGADLLKPLLVKEGVEPAGKVCIGTVHGDLHDIGKNIVKMMLEGKGFEVIDLGTDVPAETFVNTAKEQGCDVICCSALLTTTMGVMADVVKEAEKAGIRDSVKIMVGGAPVSEEFCKQIGADAYTSDAASCADLALELCKK